MGDDVMWWESVRGRKKGAADVAADLKTNGPLAEPRAKPQTDALARGATTTCRWKV